MTWSSSPTPKQSKPGATSSRISRRWAGVRSWNSSTSMRRQRAWAAARAAGSRSQDLDGPVDLLVEVDLTPLGQHGAEPVESLGDAGGVGVRLLGGVGGDQTQPHQRQRRQEGSGGVRIGLAFHLEQLAHEVAHAPISSRTRTGPDGPEGVADPEGQAVEGPHVGTVRAEHVRRPGPQLVGGAGVVGQRGDGPGVGAAPHDEAEPLGQHAGLARSGRGDHPGGTGGVVDRRQLVRGQVRLGGAPRRRGEAARLGAPAVHHGRAVARVRGVGGSAVDPQRRPVRPAHVGRTALGHPFLGQPPGTPCDRATTPGSPSRAS